MEKNRKFNHECKETEQELQRCHINLHSYEIYIQAIPLNEAQIMITLIIILVACLTRYD